MNAKTRVVPVELTGEMVEAALNAPHQVITFGTSMRDTYRAILQSQWTAMLSAAPPTANAQGDDALLTRALEERDEREAVIDEILNCVLGADRHEWSSSYGYADAILDVEDRMRPNQAQADDARDAGRYRKLKKYVTIWESQLAETRGMLSLSVEFDAVGDDLDAALDRIKDDSVSTALSRAHPQAAPGE